MKCCGDCSFFGSNECIFSDKNPSPGSMVCHAFSKIFVFKNIDEFIKLSNVLKKTVDDYNKKETNCCGQCDHFIMTCKESVGLKTPACINFRSNGIGFHTKEEIHKNIKETNSDGRTHCCACGQQLNEPYPGIRYCKNCEV